MCLSPSVNASKVNLGLLRRVFFYLINAIRSGGEQRGPNKPKKFGDGVKRSKLKESKEGKGKRKQCRSARNPWWECAGRQPEIAPTFASLLGEEPSKPVFCVCCFFNAVFVRR